MRAGMTGPTCVYIASRGHSGSTLLELLLGRHPQVTSSGEIANLGLQCMRDESTSWRATCSCGERPFDCPIWSHIIERIRSEFGVDMRRHPLAFRVSDIGLEDEMGSGGTSNRRVSLVAARKLLWRFLRLQQYGGRPWLRRLLGCYQPQRTWALNRSFILRCLAELQGAKAVIDSSKDSLGMRDMYDFSPLSVKIVFLTRDCRGNAWSYAKRDEANGRGHDATIRRVTLEWVAVNERIRRLLEGVDDRDWIHVKYEDLCQDPAETLRRIFGFIGLEYDGDVLQDRSHVEHMIAGNQIRSTNRNASIREDIAWRDHLSREDLRLISEIAAPLARSFGYQL